MGKTCPSCGKEKETVGPKVIGKSKSNDPRSMSLNDVLITKVICQDCYDSLKASNAFAQKCFNQNCDNILFVSGRLGPDTDMRGVDRDVRFQNDNKGYFIECSKCGAKHSVEMWEGPEGTGGRWKISGIRK